MKKILVTGGAGYVGAVLVPKLLKQNYEVRVLDLFIYATEKIYPAAALGSGQLKLFKGDLRDKTLLKTALTGVDTIIHLAGISNDPSSDLDPELTRKVNIQGTEAMIDMARDMGITRFINASSSSVYGIKEEANVTEELKLEPLTVYSESKVAIEDYLDRNRGKMTAVSIRSATVCGYSPRLRLDLTVNILTHHAVTKNKITVFGGVQKRPNIHIEDISDLYVQLVETPAQLIDGQQFNACGANHTVMALANLVKETVAPTATIEVLPTNDLRSYHVSADKIKQVLGYVPKRTIADAVRDLAKAFREKLVANPEEDRYYNVKTMKRVLAAA
jgi:nucleoside-diphosphate-sugar epimerase